MKFLYIVTALSLLLSFIKDREKTKRALKSGFMKFTKVVPPFVLIAMAVSITLTIFTSESISTYLGNNHEIRSGIIAAIIGSLTMVPGPIVYPLCRTLLDNGISYPVIAAFSTTLMMVGVLTFPMEKFYYGAKFAVIRNIVGFFIAILVAFTFYYLQGAL